MPANFFPINSPPNPNPKLDKTKKKNLCYLKWKVCVPFNKSIIFRKYMNQDNLILYRSVSIRFFFNLSYLNFKLADEKNCNGMFNNKQTNAASVYL